jgi:hypothetical protein
MWHAWEGRNVHRIFVWKTERKSPLERPRRGWVNGIKWILERMAGGELKQIYLAEDSDSWRTLMYAVMNVIFLLPRS